MRTDERASFSSVVSTGEHQRDDLRPRTLRLSPPRPENEGWRILLGAKGVWRNYLGITEHTALFCGQECVRGTSNAPRRCSRANKTNKKKEEKSREGPIFPVERGKERMSWEFATKWT